MSEQREINFFMIGPRMNKTRMPNDAGMMKFEDSLLLNYAKLKQLC